MDDTGKTRRQQRAENRAERITCPECGAGPMLRAHAAQHLQAAHGELNLTRSQARERCGLDGGAGAGKTTAADSPARVTEAPAPAPSSTPPKRPDEPARRSAVPWG